MALVAQKRTGLSATEAGESGQVGFSNGAYSATNVDAALVEIAAGTPLADKLDETHAKNHAQGDAKASLPIVLSWDLATGTANSQFSAATKLRVLDFWVVKTDADGDANDKITLFNGDPGGGGTAISDPIDLNIANQVVARTPKLDDAQTVVNAGALWLKNELGGGGAENTACEAFVLAVASA